MPDKSYTVFCTAIIVYSNPWSIKTSLFRELTNVTISTISAPKTTYSVIIVTVAQKLFCIQHNFQMF